MNFYHAYYKRQFYNKDLSEWIDTGYDHQGIIVIADTYDDAKFKIKKCLAKVEHGEFRAVLISDVNECIGLDRVHGFEGSFNMIPIFDT